MGFHQEIVPIKLFPFKCIEDKILVRQSKELLHQIKEIA